MQPKNLEPLAADHFRVFVFVGAKQTHVQFELVEVLQSFGPRAKYIKVSATQRDALDFHIAYYVGELSVADREAYYHIISKDKGFDPLVEHLQERALNVARREMITDIPLLRVSTKISSSEKLDAVVKNLIGRGHSKPRKQQTLANSINAIFKEPLPDAGVDKLIAQLRSKKYITIKSGKVTYDLPKPDG